jgi:hypothetical protein
MNLLLIRCRLHNARFSMQLLIAPTPSAERPRTVGSVPAALDTRFRGCEEIAFRWISADASFKASLSEAPQDEAIFFML